MVKKAYHSSLILCIFLLVSFVLFSKGIEARILSDNHRYVAEFDPNGSKVGQQIGKRLPFCNKKIYTNCINPSTPAPACTIYNKCRRHPPAP